MKNPRYYKIVNLTSGSEFRGFATRHEAVKAAQYIKKPNKVISYTPSNYELQYE
jgi:hypothetical protein